MSNQKHLWTAETSQGLRTIRVEDKITFKLIGRLKVMLFHRLQSSPRHINEKLTPESDAAVFSSSLFQLQGTGSLAEMTPWGGVIRHSCYSAWMKEGAERGHHYANVVHSVCKWFVRQVVLETLHRVFVGAEQGWRVSKAAFLSLQRGQHNIPLCPQYK